MKRTLALLLLLTTPLLAASREPVRARHGMVASTSEIASRVGVEVMKKGGNAVDAAVAVGLALAVTWPSAGNLGGGGFMLIRKADGNAEAIDYRERGPLAASRDMYLDAQGNVVKGLSTRRLSRRRRAGHRGRTGARAQAPRQTEVGGARRAGAQARRRGIRGQLPPRAQPALHEHSRRR